MPLVVFTGGARSGKSSAAQALAARVAAEGRTVSVVVFGRDDGGDAEFSARIARHRDDRPTEWTTIEAVDSTGWAAALDNESLVVLDCVGTMLGLVMEEAYAHLSHGSLHDAPADALPAGYEMAVRERLDRAIDSIVSGEHDMIVVTNEVGDGLTPGWASERLFRDLLGQANRRLVASADAAHLCVCGRLIDLHAAPTAARWPED